MGSVQQSRPSAPSFPRLSRSGPHAQSWNAGLRAAVVDGWTRKAADWRRDGYSDEQIREWLHGEAKALYVALLATADEALILAGAVEA